MPEYTVIEDGLKTSYNCNKCGTAYKSLAWITRHLQGGHRSIKRGQTENIENKVAKDVDISTEHKTVEVELDRKLKCNVCQKEIKNQKNMVKHLTTHGPFKCPECAIQFLSKKELRLHKRNTHSHVCEVCDKKTSCQIRMINHLRTHGIYKCPDCTETFTRKLDLLSHKRNVHKTKTTDTIYGISYTVVEDGAKNNYICHKCGTFRPSLSSMKYHMKRHVAPSNGMDKRKVPKKFVCDYCGKETSVKWKMLRHIRLWHTLIRCSECLAECGNSFDLALHKREYHPQTMPTCGVCGFKCFEKSLLIIHQRKVHMGEKNVSCPHCDAKFFNRRMLNRHLVRHNPVKKFECKFCKKKFPRKNTRNMHEKIHLGHKNKVCLICDARFVQKASLNYHMKKYHPEAI